jgi:hypothetical protein
LERKIAVPNTSSGDLKDAMGLAVRHLGHALPANADIVEESMSNATVEA